MLTFSELSVAVRGRESSFCLATRQVPSAAVCEWLMLAKYWQLSNLWGGGKHLHEIYVITDSPWDDFSPEWKLVSLHSSKASLRKQWLKCIISTCEVALSYSLPPIFHFAISVKAIPRLPISGGNWWSPGWLFCIMTSSSMTSGTGNTQPQIDALPHNCTEAQAHFRCMKKASEINVLSHLKCIQSQEAG